MLLAIAAIIAGLVLLVWSADRFIEGAAATAKHLGMPSLLIGMVILLYLFLLQMVSIQIQQHLQ